MVTFTSAQPCEGLLPDCSVGVKGTGGKTTQVEHICSMHGNLLPDKLLQVWQGRLWVTDVEIMYSGTRFASGKRHAWMTG